MYRILLNNRIKKGRLTIKFDNAPTERFGHEGQEVIWRVNSRKTLWKIVSHWEFQLGETYVDGEWSVEEGTLFDLLTLLRINFMLPSNPLGTCLGKVMQLLQQSRNGLSRARNNVATHYDLETELFRLMLDDEMNYSCAYYSDSLESLENAQVNKCEHIGKKLLPEAGQHLLDIGCGWGSLAIHLAETYNVKVTGLTLSEEQYRVAVDRVKSKQLDHLIDLRLEDYRNHHGSYDRVVSIGMFEHVGRSNFQTYFNAVNDLMAPDGVALIHTIGRTSYPRQTNSWIRKYIFPGGYLPSLSEVSRAIENTSLHTVDIEVLRGHYEMTLAAWRERFVLSRDKFVELAGEKYARVWEFYLTISEVAFRYTELSVFQFQLIKHKDVVPITRDYLYT